MNDRARYPRIVGRSFTVLQHERLLKLGPYGLCHRDVPSEHAWL